MVGVRRQLGKALPIWLRIIDRTNFFKIIWYKEFIMWANDELDYSSNC